MDENTNEINETVDEDVIVVDDDITLINALLAMTSESYANAEGQEDKKLYFHQMMELLEKKNKILEQRAFEEKTKIEAEMKLKMNELDNQTKLAQAKMERNMKILSGVMQGCDIAARVGMTGVKLRFAAANIGDARRFDANGYVTPSSNSSKLADRYAQQVFKLDKPMD